MEIWGGCNANGYNNNKTVTAANCVECVHLLGLHLMAIKIELVVVLIDCGALGVYIRSLDDKCPHQPMP